MLITIEGYRKHNQALFCALGSAVEFYGDKLLGKRMARNILVEIKLTKDLKGKENAYGFCHVTDDNLSRPREFSIELDTSMRFKFDQILTWLGHEMVHIKQFVRNELYDFEMNKTQWKSRIYKTNSSYKDQPWEKEAYRLEDKLYKEFEEWYYESRN